MLKILSRLCLLLLTSTFVTAPLQAEVNVVASIRPLHSIAAYVTQGVGQPNLLIDGFSSPHNFQLRPSKARQLQNADLIVWIGEDLETFLVKPLKSLDADQLEVMTLDSITRLELRDHMDLGGHSHHHGNEDGHGDEHEDELHFDAHVWLDPNNAIAVATGLADRLSVLDPKNAATYQRNAENFAQDMQQAISKIETLITPVRETNFFVFHDAFQYFENAFDIKASQAVTPSVEQQPGAKRMRQLQNDIQNQSIKCVFVEPQGSHKLIELAVEGSNAHIAELDVLGVRSAQGPKLYKQMLINLATVMNDCLSRD